MTYFDTDRFSAEFMFELSDKEFREWRCQIGTSNFGDKMGLRYRPFAFTEQGVTMLSRRARCLPAEALA